MSPNFLCIIFLINTSSKTGKVCKNSVRPILAQRKKEVFSNTFFLHYGIFLEIFSACFSVISFAQSKISLSGPSGFHMIPRQILIQVTLRHYISSKQATMLEKTMRTLRRISWIAWVQVWLATLQTCLDCQAFLTSYGYFRWPVLFLNLN